MTPAWSQASWILPGKPWITGQVWRALKSAGAQPTMKDLSYTQASETLSAAIWRQICEHFPSILKRINNVFLLLNYFLKIVIFAVFLFCSNYLCYLSHVDAYAHAQEHLILSSDYFSFSFSRTENLWKGKSLWSQVSMHTKILIVVYKCKTNPHIKKDKQCISDVHTNISCVKLLINVVVIHK